MMAQIARFDYINRVIFVNPVRSIRNILARNAPERKTSPGTVNKLLPSKITSKIWEYTPLRFLPFAGQLNRFEEIENRIMLRVIKKLNSGLPYILFINSPETFFEHLLDDLQRTAELSIFDFSDDFVEYFPNERVEARDTCLQKITKYVKSADIVLAVNEHTKKKYSHLNRNIHVIRNATNYFNFQRETYRKIDVLERIRNTNMPILGYTGGINPSRMDLSILDSLFQQRPHWFYVFIGPAYSSFIERYRKFHNFYHLPPVDYTTLPDYIRYFDVAIVPLKVNEHTRGNDLLKFHDYLAMAKPIVSTDMGGANDLKGIIRIAYGPSDFMQKVEQALSSQTPEEIALRKKLAYDNSWHKRIEPLRALLQTHLDGRRHLLASNEPAVAG